MPTCSDCWYRKLAPSAEPCASCIGHSHYVNLQERVAKKIAKNKQRFPRVSPKCWECKHCALPVDDPKCHRCVHVDLHSFKQIGANK